MKILIVRNYPSYMAVKNNTYNIQEVGLAKALVRRGNICDILFWTDKEEETVTLPVDGSGEIKVFYRRGKTMLKNTVYTGCGELFEQYDILQPCEYNQLQAWLLAKRFPEKTVIYHGPYYASFNKRYNLMCKAFDALFLKSYIRRGTRFLVKSDMAKDFLVGKGISGKNVKTVGVGIDAQMLSSADGACDEKLYLQMKADKDALKLLYIGRFEERRNIPFIMDIFAAVLQKNSDARLYMIGTGDAGYVKNAFEYAQQLGVMDKIVWQERMEQKYLSEVYKSADFFLLPTEYEIFGMVLLEAMFYKTVVLTTLNGGSATLIDDGESGFIIDEKNAEKWASRIADVCEDKELMQAITEKASARIKNEFTWDALAEGFIEQYELKKKGR
ncbi:MAG: glycosyltransferase family 4 protein [Oscillospiraceae bacterium]|nr:glycosyltransferase family 4 protein [Oscillospiraceae bacterium]